jgi:integrase
MEDSKSTPCARARNLRKLHNFALDMNWLPVAVSPRRQWPEVFFKEKSATTPDEHERIVANEGGWEREGFYRLCLHLRASQGDLVRLIAQDGDWENETVSLFGKKTGVPVVVHLGKEALSVLRIYEAKDRYSHRSEPSREAQT